MKVLVAVACAVAVVLVTKVQGHGRMTSPPARGTAWRYGFNTPANYNDNEMNCGGFNNQHANNGGKCGECGDPYQGPLHHQAGGMYATGTIVDTYTAGSNIQVVIEITANHKGWHEFRLCEQNDPTTPITQECLDQHLLPDPTTGETKLYLNSPDNRNFTYTLQLPAGVTCEQCVLQWKYNAGNSWGVDSETGEGCVGCGPQEQFYGCADVTIVGSGDGSNPGTTSTSSAPQSSSTEGATTTLEYKTTTTAAPSTTTTARNQNQGQSDGKGCVPTEIYKDTPNMVEWCQTNCALGNCPESHCVCPKKPRSSRKISPRRTLGKNARK